MTEHYLDPLLRPARIALVGASEREGTPGARLAEMVVNSDFSGEVYLVNPRSPEILGRKVLPTIEALPAGIDHVVIALGNEHLESALQAAIKQGVRAATIYSSGILGNDAEPKLIERLSAMARGAGMHVCGLNGMGFYNVGANLYAGIFPRNEAIIKGEISYIAQSGSAFTTLCHNGCRLGFNLCVSAGNELTTSVADYMDWSLEQADTRVIGLFLETVRDPQAFVAALEKANKKSIPVVVLKIGKSPLGASMALTHTGAIAGNHAVFEALFKRHGVIEVGDFDEMASILMLLQSGREAADGGFAAAFESGGFRELVTDEAYELGIEFAPLEHATIAELEKHLDPGLKAENPLDAWGSHERFEERFEACMNALMQDPNVAAGAFISNYRDGYYLSEAIYRAVESVSRKTDKPIALATCYSDLDNAGICRRAHAAGIPVIDGAHQALLAFRHLFDYHRFRRRPARALSQASQNQPRLETWRQKLATHGPRSLGESDALDLLADLGMPVVRHETVKNRAELLAAAADIGYPLVLKTAMGGLDHKSDSNGVFVNIGTEVELLLHYEDLCNRLGPDALLSRMLGGGVEIGLGTLNDAQFGPIVMVAAGGVLIELLSDRAVAMCPVDAIEADELLSSLEADRLLRGIRGAAAVNRRCLIESIVRLSQIAWELRDCIESIDINPVIATSNDSLAVDALITPRAGVPINSAQRQTSSGSTDFIR